MTLILSLATPQYVLQVTDRLLTRKVKNNISKFDQVSNKNIIYKARDAIVTFGYTGVAYIDNKPTDTWIVEKLRGKIFSKDCREIYLGFESSDQNLDIGQSIRMLSEELTVALKKSPIKQFTLVAVGWQWYRRKKPVPQMWSVDFTDNSVNSKL